MEQELYFNYGGKIQSRKLAEAISTPIGVGPLCGFGSAKVEGSNLLVYPYGRGDSNSSTGTSEEYKDPLRYLIRSRIRSRNIVGGDLSEPAYALIARDGTIWRSTPGDNNCITVSIEGTYSDEVLLFAVHTPITEAVENPVTFKAYYNNSSVDFYNIYKKSIDPYYPKDDSALVGTITQTDEDDPFLTEESTFNYVEDKAKTAVSDFSDNFNNWVLIGIYGSGYDESSDINENFSIVLYSGGGVAELPYSYGIHNFLLRAINRIETFLYTDLGTDSNGNNFTSLVDYLDSRTSSSDSDFQEQIDNLKTTVEENILQQGSIILWDGDSIPDGWEEYSAAAGRIVIGYSATGITTAQGTALTSVGSTYTPSTTYGTYYFSVKGSDLPSHYHAIGFAKKGLYDSTPLDNCMPTNFDNRESDINGIWGVNKTINKRPTYTAGALRTSLNLSSTSNSGSITETSKTTLDIDKLVPAITLRYIRKVNS